MSKGQIVLRVAIVLTLSMILTMAVCVGLLIVLSWFNPNAGIVFVAIMFIAVLAVALMTPASNYYYNAKRILRKRRQLAK